MTLVTGFMTGNAVILCADSEEVVGDYSKSRTQKIRPSMHHGNWRMAVAGAGPAPNIDYFEHKLAMNLAEVHEYDYQQIVETTEATLHFVYEQHIWPDPDRDREEFQTLIALQGLNPVRTRALLWTHKTKVIPIREYKSIGVGSHLADYIYSQVFPRIGTIYNSPTEQIANLGVYMLQNVKEGIQDVDGETNILIFYGDSGEMRWMIEPEIEEVEYWMNHFHLAQLSLMMAVANPRMRQGEFEDELRLFRVKMTKIKEAQAASMAEQDRAHAHWEQIQQCQQRNVERDAAAARALLAAIVGENQWIEPEIFCLTSGKPLGINKFSLRFRKVGVDQGFGNKPIIDFDGESLYPELAILRLLEKHGFDGVWVDSYRNKFWGAMSSEKPLPEEAHHVYERILQARTGRRGGFWDVMAWKDGEYLFIEAKQNTADCRDTISQKQIEWLEAAMTVEPTAFHFFVCEWGWE